MKINVKIIYLKTESAILELCVGICNVLSTKFNDGVWCSLNKQIPFLSYLTAIFCLKYICIR